MPLLCAAALLHVALSFSLQEVGRRQLWPGTFDASGDAVAFAPDAACFRDDAAQLASVLRAGAFRSWLGADYQFHEKLYAVCFALCGGLLGYGVVGAEPLNLLFYLLSLVLVYGLGREVFGRRAGLLAALALALWPSLLLHTTQLVKDALFLALALALVLCVVRWTTRDYTGALALLNGAAGALLVTASWLARSGMGVLLVATVLLGALALVVRLLREWRARASHLWATALVLAAALAVPVVMPQALKLGGYREAAKSASARRSRPADEAGETAGGASGLLAKAAAHVGKVRRRFVETYPDSGSNIDADVEIDGTGDLLRYLPRAVEVGLFAPFPKMWLARGKTVGSAGRLLAGVETLAMYVVEALALVGLWVGRRRLAAWFLFAVAATCVTALGLVVVNVGALYRMRYLCLALLLVLAAGGASEVLGRLSKRARAAGFSPGADERAELFV